jgi:hypothetical protein
VSSEPKQGPDAEKVSDVLQNEKPNTHTLKIELPVGRGLFEQSKAGAFANSLTPWKDRQVAFTVCPRCRGSKFQRNGLGGVRQCGLCKGTGTNPDPTDPSYR